MERRLDWIDTAKGLGIILVVLGHNEAPTYLLKSIYAFHMPLFFFLSGYLANPAKYPKATVFFKRKLVRLMIPYAVFNVITYLYWILVDKPQATYENVIMPLKGMLYGIGTDGWLLHNNALWFLPCLFFVEILFYFSVRIIKNYHYLAAALIGFGILGVYLPKLVSPRLPWSIDTAFTAIVFYGVGYLFEKKSDIEAKLSPALCGVAALTYTLVFSHCNKIPIVDMNSATYGNILYFYLSAFSGIVFIIIVALKLSHLESLKYLGRNSLIIFGLHIIPIKIFKNQLGMGLNVSLIESLVCTVGEIALLIPLLYILKMSNNYIAKLKKC